MQLPNREIALLLLLAFSLVSCGEREIATDERGARVSANIVAGPGEKTFSERYDQKLTLPVSEGEFLALIKKLGMSYEVCGEIGSKLGLPAPRQAHKVDVSTAVKCYEIDGEVDSVHHVSETYRAFMDRNHQIFYIENAFSYTDL